MPRATSQPHPEHIEVGVGIGIGVELKYAAKGRGTFSRTGALMEVNGRQT